MLRRAPRSIWANWTQTPVDEQSQQVVPVAKPVSTVYVSSNQELDITSDVSDKSQYPVPDLSDLSIDCSIEEIMAAAGRTSLDAVHDHHDLVSLVMSLARRLIERRAELENSYNVDLLDEVETGLDLVVDLLKNHKIE